MAVTANTIDHVTLQHLVEAGAVRSASIVGQPGGWGVVVQYGMTERVLSARRGALRKFRKFETLVSYLKGVGIAKFEVDATQFDPDAPKTERKRIDASERMKRAHEAVAYKTWLTQEVNEAINDPRPSVAHADVVSAWEAERAALLARVERTEV